MTDTQAGPGDSGVLTKRLQESYTNEAEHYERKRIESFHGNFHHDLICRAIDDAMISYSPSVVLDCPTGTGRILPTLASRADKVLAVDATGAMLDVARRRTTEKELDNVELSLGDALDLPFEDNSIDTIFSLRFFHLLPVDGYDPFLREMHRVLKPGGTAVLEFANARYGLFANSLKSVVGTNTSRSYVAPSTLREIVQPFQLAKLDGLYLPFTAHLARISTPAALVVSKSGRHFPMNKICYELFAHCVK